MVTLQHIDHLLLGFLEDVCKLDAHGIGQLIHLRVLLLDELHQLIHFLFEVVKSFAFKHSSLQILQKCFYGGLLNLLECLFKGSLLLD